MQERTDSNSHAWIASSPSAWADFSSSEEFICKLCPGLRPLHWSERVRENRLGYVFPVTCKFYNEAFISESFMADASRIEAFRIKASITGDVYRVVFSFVYCLVPRVIVAW